LGAVVVFTARALRNEPIQIVGTLDDARDLLHVDDLAELVAACVRSKASGTYPVGSPELVTLRSIIERLTTLPGRTPTTDVRVGTGEPSSVGSDSTTGRSPWPPDGGRDAGSSTNSARWSSR